MTYKNGKYPDSIMAIFTKCKEDYKKAKEKSTHSYSSKSYYFYP